MRAASRLDQVPYEPHMLDAASSPLISALPQYERSFLDHLGLGQAYFGAMEVTCRSLYAPGRRSSRHVAMLCLPMVLPMPAKWQCAQNRP